jgi:hypothetical protein
MNIWSQPWLLPPNMCRLRANTPLQATTGKLRLPVVAALRALATPELKLYTSGGSSAA